MDNKALGQALKEARLRKRITGQQLADLVEVNSRATISNIERGFQRIPKNKLEIFAKVLDVSPAYLAGFEDINGNKLDSNGNVICTNNLNNDNLLDIDKLAKSIKEQVLNELNISNNINSSSILSIDLSDLTEAERKTVLIKLEEIINDIKKNRK